MAGIKRTWNVGIMEYWNDGMMDKTKPIIPIFHYSIIPLLFMVF